MWMLYVLIYGIIKGIRDICKKKALDNNTVIEALTASSIISAVIMLPDAPNAMGLLPEQYLWIALKSFVIFVSWILGLMAIRKLPISMYGVLDLSRVLFATFLAVTVLNEKPTVNKTIGMVLVCAGLLFLKFNPFEKKENAAPKEKFSLKRGSYTWYVLLAFISCALNAVSGLLDKILMSEMNHSQLQFWYVIFLTAYYLLYVVFTHTKIHASVWKNIWVWLLGILLVVMDRVLFIANANPASQVTIMTLIKQSGVIVAILAGKYVFKEKDILHKAICAAIVVTGILFGVMNFGG